MTRLRRLRRVTLVVALVAAGLELLYVVVGNLLLASPLPQRLANQAPEAFQLHYLSARTLWPGRIYAKDISIRFQDPNVAFQLSMKTSRVDVALPDLFRRHFRVAHARGTGVSYRMLLKVDSTDGQAERVAAFPPLEGVEAPALRKPQPPPPPPPTAAELRKLWSIEFDDIDADLEEVWLFEYHYLGRGRARGSFGVAPMKHVWVGPASTQLEPGELTVGRHVVSKELRVEATTTIAPFSISTPPGIELLASLTASVRLELPVADLKFATIYLPGAEISGDGLVSGELQMRAGRLAPGGRLTARFPQVHVREKGVGFDGDANAVLGIGRQPIVDARLSGALAVRLPGGDDDLIATVRGTNGRLVLASSDMSRGVKLASLRAAVRKVKAADARPLVALASTKAPFFSQMLLGDGPLTASAAIEMNPRRLVVHLLDSKLGAADLRGSMILQAKKWRGALSGHLGDLSVGVRIDDGVPQVFPLVPADWLDQQRATDGVAPPAT